MVTRPPLTDCDECGPIALPCTRCERTVQVRALDPAIAEMRRTLHPEGTE